jgi:hypothetical protein
MEIEEAIQSGPAEDTRMGIVCLPGARLPDPFIRLLPVATDIFTKCAKHLLGLAIENTTLLNEVAHGVNDLTIDIELNLFACCIADPNRS